MNVFNMDDNKKIGMGLLALTTVLYFLGFLFLFDRFLLIFANLCFISGLYFMIGFKDTIAFFLKKGKVKYSVIFLVGFVVMITGHSFIGGVMQIYSLILLFKSFLPVVFDALFGLPIIGPILKNNPLTKYLYARATTDKRPNI